MRVFLSGNVAVSCFNKRPTELSGGMGRRASLALQLAQHKHVIVLDEPFAGLDYEAAMSVAKELVHVRQTQGTAFLLISHEPEIAAIVMGNANDPLNQTITLEPPVRVSKDDLHSATTSKSPNLFGTTFRDRFLERLMDYFGYSLPLILLAFLASGLAVALLSADLLHRLDVTQDVLDIVQKEIRPLLKMLTGEEPGALTMMGVQFKVRSMLQQTIPGAKATMYALGMTKLFVLEVGPLLTALLLAGRIGGSYAGKVATLQATRQTDLLRTLGIRPLQWSLLPSLAAAVLAAPLLTILGTAMAVFCGQLVGPWYGIGDAESYATQFHKAVFPVLRLRFLAPLWSTDGDDGSSLLYTWWTILSNVTRWDWRCTFSSNKDASPYVDSLVEILTYPPMYHVVKAITYMTLTLAVAEITCASATAFSGRRWWGSRGGHQQQQHEQRLTPRHVPGVITASVVISSLVILVADWGFSQLWLLRR